MLYKKNELLPPVCLILKVPVKVQKKKKNPRIFCLFWYRKGIYVYKSGSIGRLSGFVFKHEGDNIEYLNKVYLFFFKKKKKCRVTWDRCFSLIKEKKKKITNAFFLKEKKYLISYFFTSDMKTIPCIIEMLTLPPPLYSKKSNNLLDAPPK
jgi:hypothetical protein